MIPASGCDAPSGSGISVDRFRLEVLDGCWMRVAGRRIRRHSDGLQYSFDRIGICNPGYSLHPRIAAGTAKYVHLMHSGQQIGPQETVIAVVGLIWVLVVATGACALGIRKI